MKKIRITPIVIAKLAYKRQSKKKADIFIIIYGLPRSGKTTLGFVLLIAYIKLRLLLYEKGIDKTWKPEDSIIEIFQKYFSDDCKGMSNKLKNNPPTSPAFVDEGLDIVSWHKRLTNEQKDLIELINKTGKRMNFIELLIPSVNLLTKEILARAQYLMIIPEEPTNDENYAYVLKNYTVPFMAENHPFGIDNIERDLIKHPKISRNKKLFMKYLMDRERFIGVIKFHRIDEELYNLYDKIVKEPSIMKDRPPEQSVVAYTKFARAEWRLLTLISNLLKKKKLKNINEMQKLFVDKFGNETLTYPAIKTKWEQEKNVKNSEDVLSMFVEKTEEFKTEKNLKDISLKKILKITRIS